MLSITSQGQGVYPCAVFTSGALTLQYWKGCRWKITTLLHAFYNLKKKNCGLELWKPIFTAPYGPVNVSCMLQIFAAEKPYSNIFIARLPLFILIEQVLWCEHGSRLWSTYVSNPHSKESNLCFFAISDVKRVFFLDRIKRWLSQCFGDGSQNFTQRQRSWNY